MSLSNSSNKLPQIKDALNLPGSFPTTTTTYIVIIMTHTTTKQASIGDTGATAIATKSRNAPMLNNRTTYFTGTEQQRYMREQLVQVK